MSKNIEFGEYIFKLRMKRKLTLTQLGELVGISTNYASELERGKKEPSDEVVRKLARAYNVSEEQLFAIMKRVPLGIKEEIESSHEFRNLMVEIAKNKNLTDDTKEKIYTKVREYYEGLMKNV